MDIFELLNLSKKKPCLIRCPYRKDSTPSFSIWFYNGEWFWKDWGRGEGGTVLHLLMKLKNISKQEAIKILTEDNPNYLSNYQFNMNQKKEIAIEKSIEKFKYTPLLNPEYNYMNKVVGVSIDTLKKYNVEETKHISGKNVEVSGELYIYNTPSIFDSSDISKKMYKPDADKKKKEIKFYGSKKWHHVFGWSSLTPGASLAFICAGEKDTLCMLDYQEKVSAICFNSETYMPNEMILDKMKSFNIALWAIVYDNDDTGREFAIKLQEYLKKENINAIVRHPPEEFKDVADWYASFNAR